MTGDADTVLDFLIVAPQKEREAGEISFKNVFYLPQCYWSHNFNYGSNMLSI